MYPIHILLYLTTGKLLTDPETENGNANIHREEGDDAGKKV